MSQSDKETAQTTILSDPRDTAAMAARIQGLNERYHPLSVEERMRQLYKDFPPERVMLTSSFAANSAMLLHLCSCYAPHQKVHFIDTGFHFPETLEYKKMLTELYELNVEEVRAEEWKHEFTEKEQTYKTDQDFCCSINKVEPLESIKKEFEVWISGLVRWQTEYRASLDIFEFRAGMIKFYPIVDVSKEERDAYIREHELPFHPLVEKGYSSLGCVHCTIPGDDRSGRWVDSAKSECGLHL